MEATERLTARDVDQATGGYVNTGVLRSWIKQECMPWDVQPSGRGREREYQRYEIVLLAVMAEFRRRGLGLKTAASWTRRFAEYVLAEEDIVYIAWSGEDATALFIKKSDGITLDQLMKMMGFPPGFSVIHPHQIMRQVYEVLEPNTGPADKRGI